MKKILLISLVALIIDQVIKHILILNFSFGQSIDVIKNFFSITLVKNTGAAFSLFSSNTLFLIIVSIIALILIYLFFIKNNILDKYDIILYGCLIGGILGNLIDRIIRGYVIDYLDFNIHFPVFNFADILITVSIFIIVVKTIKGDKNEVYSR